MNKYLFVFICFYFYLTGFSQNPDKLKIPESNNEISKGNGDIYFDIYLTKRGEIYLNDKRIKLKELADAIIKLKSKVKINEFISVYPILYIEIDTKYERVEKLKHEISRAWVNYIIYKTYNENFFSGFQRQLHMSSNYIEKTVILENDGNYKIDLNISNHYDLAEIAELEFNLYNQKFEDFLNSIKKRKYKKIKILSKDYFKVNGSKINFNNSNFTKSINDCEIVFISYSKNLKYQDYLYVLSTLKDKKGTFLFIQNSFKVNGKNYIPFIEISSKLNKTLKKYHIKF